MYYTGDRNTVCKAINLEYSEKKKYHYLKDNLELKVFKDKIILYVDDSTGGDIGMLWLARVLLVLTCNDIKIEVYYRGNKVSSMSKLIKYREEVR